MPGTGAGGMVGVALETVPGTYLAPTDFIPIRSESIGYLQETVWRRPIRQTASVFGSSDGNSRVEGEISIEAYEDIVAILLQTARATVVKSGTASPGFTYAYTGNANAIPNRTASFTIVRNGIPMAYTGCIVGGFNFAIEDGLLIFNATIMGRDEATQSLPTPTWATGIHRQAYGAGKYKIEIPTSTQVFDCDNFTFTVDDSPTAQYRLKDTGRGAQFISYGERTTGMTIDRDFENRTDYDAFKTGTAQSVTLTATKGANNSIALLLPAAIKDTYEVGISGQGDLIRAAVAYQGTVDAAGVDYTITVKTQKDIT
jgi:hypothetical protein